KNACARRLGYHLSPAGRGASPRSVQTERRTSTVGMHSVPESGLATRRLHRRTMLGQLAATFGAVGVGLVSTAAVSAPAAAAVTSKPMISSRAAAQGGATKIITIGEWQPVSIMNTLMTSEGGNVISGTKLALRGLLFTDEKGSPAPELATEVPSLQNGGISADGTTITY